MSTVKGKNKLCSTPANGLSVENIGGIPFYDRYVEFDHLLQKYIIDRRFKDSFAEPLFNDAGGTIDWYVPSQYAGIPRLEDLKGTVDYDTAVRQKDACIQYLKRQMLDMPDHDRQYFDCLIKYANSDISDYTTFFKDGHVIFGVWGLQLNGQKDVSMAIRTDIDDRRVYTITYQMIGNGIFTGVDSVIKRKHGHTLSGPVDIPNVVPDEGYEFSSWEPDAPHNKVVDSDLVFTAVCTPVLQVNDPDPEPEPEPEEEVPVIAPSIEEPIQETPTFSEVKFDPANFGKLKKGARAVQVQNGKAVDPAIIPQVKAKPGYEFVGWDKDTTEPMTKDTVFKAQYERKEGSGGLVGAGPVGGFFGRGGGCLNWLIGLLGALLLLFLLSLLLRACGAGLIPGRTPIVTDEEIVTTEETITTQPKHQLPAPVVEGELEKDKVTTEKEVDYEAVRALIEEYQQRIDELAKMLPESGDK